MTFAAVLQHFAQAGERQKAYDFEFQRDFILLSQGRGKSTIKPQRKDTFGGGGDPGGKRVDKNKGFTHRPLQNRSGKPNSMAPRLKRGLNANFSGKVRQTAARS